MNDTDYHRATADYHNALGDLRRNLRSASTETRATIRAFVELVRAAHRLDGQPGRYVRSLLDNLAADLRG